VAVVKPAWHEPFTPEALRYEPPLPLLEAMTPEWAWGGSTGRGVRVGIIDSGINADHPAVGGMVRGGVTVVDQGGTPTYDTSSYEDAFGHGTACAGIVHRVAPEAELYAIRVMGPSGGGTGAMFAAGLRWAIENNLQVLNLSLGTTKRDWFAALHDLADAAYFRKVVVVTAANNYPQVSFPSLYASVISVACSEEKDPLRFYYNPAPPVEFGAPGIEVEVAWEGGGYATMTGNSFAAPHIAGIVALILAKHPGLTPFLVKTILHSTAWNVRNPGPEGALAEFGQ
jgi:subtilisin family serine protease